LILATLNYHLDTALVNSRAGQLQRRMRPQPTFMLLSKA